MSEVAKFGATASFNSELARGPRKPVKAKRLLFVLGDQLDRKAAALGDLNPESDVILMTEVAQEAEHVPSHLQRTTLFLSAMRHFALQLVADGFRLRYVTLDDPANTQAFDSELKRALTDLSPERVLVSEPGEHRVEGMIRKTCTHAGIPLEILTDESFSCSRAEFDNWAENRQNLVMEYFYRQRRRELDILISGGKPEGGSWNYDKDNRQSFRSEPQIPAAYRARSDGISEEVLRLVKRKFPAAYGQLDHFRWPVNRAQAKRALRKFIKERLVHFGTYEDAMWAGEPILYHSAMSSALNLKLLRPLECVQAAMRAYQNGKVALNNVEGFVRQIIGWREFMRGVYYREGPDYVNRNGLSQTGRLPWFYWNAETEMICLRHCLGEVLEHGYGHHIPRLMVIGNFALIAGVKPRLVHDWFLGMYVDGVEWVTAPNVIGMSQHADGGVVATKPYAASGKYIKRMSNYCASCRYDVDQRAGKDACPFNTFYWDFLIRNQQRLLRNQRMKLVMKNVDRMDTADKKEIQTQSKKLRQQFDIE
jgi:deoxyribodipyrimidine photolyase-related protein